MRNYSRTWRQANKEQLREKNRVYNLQNKARKKLSHLKKTYGLSSADYASLLQRQEGLCLVCALPLLDDVAVDHAHDATCKVRGLLHKKCNSGIGLLKDDPMILKRAAKYLEENS
jgi:5-methylcytosine-specific restriction endonuclease McrA